MKSFTENSAPAPKSDCTLVVMAKAPKPGMVKTRLARNIPVEEVTELYRCFLGDTLALARSVGTAEVAIMCPASDVEELTRLAAGLVGVVAQSGNGLASGLTSVFAHFTVPGQQRVVAFNSDSPHLPTSVLESAFETLTGHDVGVGPTHDGGYYLVGAKAAYPTPFKSDGMGTNSALEALLARSRGLGLSVGFTEPFYDIDVEVDLTRLASELRLAPARAPRTAAWLKRRKQAEVQLPTVMEKL